MGASHIKEMSDSQSMRAGRGEWSGWAHQKHAPSESSEHATTRMGPAQPCQPNLRRNTQHVDARRRHTRVCPTQWQSNKQTCTTAQARPEGSAAMDGHPGHNVSLRGDVGQGRPSRQDRQTEDTAAAGKPAATVAWWARSDECAANTPWQGWTGTSSPPTLNSWWQAKRRGDEAVLSGLQP